MWKFIKKLFSLKTRIKLYDSMHKKDGGYVRVDLKGHDPKTIRTFYENGNWRVSSPTPGRRYSWNTIVLLIK